MRDERFDTIGTDFLNPYFSGLKRIMSEVIKPKKLEYIIQKLTLKDINYNIMREMTQPY